jgi:signal transduction histidine kinase
VRASALKPPQLRTSSSKGAAVLGRLSITQKLATAIMAPLVVLGGLSAVGVSTFNQVKVNGPEYKKLAAADELVSDIIPPPASILEFHLLSQSMLTASPEEFKTLLQQTAVLQKEYGSRTKYWTANIDKIGDPALRAPFLGDAHTAADAYFKIFNEEYVPSIQAAIKDGWNPKAAEAEFVLHQDAVKAQEVFASQLTSRYKEHSVAISQTVQLAVARKTAVQNETRDAISKRLLGLGLIAIAGAVATFLLGSFIARAIRRPILQLTEAANRAASEDLPRMVAAAQASTDDTPLPHLDPVRVDSSDEVAELAKAFSSMQNTALGLATQQALVRRNVSENLVNLARRNQALLGRTLNLLTQLEQDERDPDKLQDLFRVDHLTTRMRRNAESLLVLAGAEQNRQYSEGIDMGDVVRAAVSAIESFDRVDIVGLENVQVKGNAVNDVAHLFAELIENATNFSPPDSRVAVIGKAKSDGYLLVITDDGLGMAADDLHLANARIAEFAAFDATPSKVLGLNVVGRLASRHGIEVSLAESATAGVAARIVIPASLLEGLVIGMDETVGDGTPASAFGDSDFQAYDQAEAAFAAPVTTADAWPTELVSGVAAPEVGSWDHVDQSSEAVEEVSTLPTFEAPVGEASAFDDSAFGATDVEVTAAEILPPQDNVRELRRSSLSRRVRGAQMVDTGPEAVDEEPDDSEDRPATVMSTLSNLQQGFKRARSEHPSTQAIDDSAFSVVAETLSTPTDAEPSEQIPTYVSEPTEISEIEAQFAPDYVSNDVVSDALTVAPVFETQEALAPVRTVEQPKKKTLLGRRVKGAQMPDTGAIVDRTQGTDANPDEVRSALSSLQRGVASGHAAIESEGLQDAEV